ncbi:ornithine cyclodeaminase family protein [Kibdelosporangium persicum]|uniref:Ectoine utilization protein EutC n=1 Tax=Kibdelosporangium persicum TaxID=2698649 RepID=A0ABX2F7E6_9PSEU|nr:ornithine cyclodeaminase family protein [Kibdelosporangium persicum]NRN67113.1 Ectoine utilization protein EutC [Kibdelosporangium persicum]
MRYLSETESASLVTEELAYTAVRQALIEAADSQATVFPVVHGHAAEATNRFTVKSASSPSLVGLKMGSYFPGNDARGIPRHGSSILLLDKDTGRLAAVVEAARVNAYRTAAADAVAADVLARPDARTLTVFGTGHQALYECVALSKIRDLKAIHVAGRSAERTRQFVEALADKGLDADRAEPREACEQADIIVTATTATSPLFEADWVRPGTHVASMGSDARGKQELPPDLLRRARLCCDLPSQSVTIGEFQHVADLADTVTAIGDVLVGAAEGRRSPEDITVFDSSGIALQDLHVAQALLAIRK